eukprot:jgi/Tetstr1/421845/TSEL_012745.t1
MACLSTAPALSAAPAAARPRAQRARLSVHAAASGESVAGRRQMLTATAGLLAAGLLPTQKASAVECSLMGAVPCMPAPPNGEPRYKLFDGPAYDPAKEAEKRLKEKFAAEKKASEPAPAPAPASE